MKLKAPAFAALLAISVIVGFAVTAYAAPTVSGCVVYYSDSSFATEVGYQCWNCGVPYLSGSRSAYVDALNPFDGCGEHEGTYYTCTYWYNPITGHENLQCTCEGC